MSLEDAIGSHRTGWYVVTRMPEGTRDDGILVPATAAVDVEVTAVDPVLDTLTSVAHGLATGGGPYRLLDGRGQLDAVTDPALPAPLGVASQYWVIRVDANTLQLATSQANAVALVAVDITDNVGAELVITSTGFMIEASVQPWSGRSLSPDEEADTTSDKKLCLVVDQLFTRRPGFEPDSVTIDGESWTVTDSEFWEHWGTHHYECAIERDEIT